MTTIAVTGAAGQLGRYVIAKLKEKIAPSDIVAIVRNTSKSKNLGVAVRQADYTDPGALGAAMQGIDKLLLISGNEIGKRIAQHRNIIDAAKKAGVKHIVYTSLLRADTSPLSVAREHPVTESDLKHSGVDYTK